jgi:hypothetical protein
MAHHGEQGGVEPAAVLVMAFQITGRSLGLALCPPRWRESLEHGGVGGAEPNQTSRISVLLV